MSTDMEQSETEVNQIPEAGQADDSSRPSSGNNRGRGGGRRHTHSGRRGGDSHGRGGFKRRNSDAHFKGSKRGRFRSIVYPTGGNERDPLNLNSVTPGTVDPPVKRPKDLPLKIKIPGTKHDPLNLLGEVPQEIVPEVVVDDPIVSPIVRGMFSNNRNKRKSDVTKTAEEKKDDTKKEDSELTPEQLKAKQNKEKKEAFNNRYSYGNFDRYYGNRLINGQKDQRLFSFKREWFERKTVLDIGCNVGFLTISIAKEFAPRRILGIDIDPHLVGVARKNIRHYCDKDMEMVGKFPASFSQQFGPISQTSLSFSTKFPDNVWFRTENFVLESDELLETVEEEYDVIMALSITKWIHLNWGDDGMRRFFKRCYSSLLPGGRLILEPQAFETYRKRSVMTETLRSNYRSIEFKPEDFEMYLLEECSFESVEHIQVPQAKSKGFSRPIDVYRKALPSFMRKKEKKEKEKMKKEEEKKDEDEKNDDTVDEKKSEEEDK